MCFFLAVLAVGCCEMYFSFAKPCRRLRHLHHGKSRWSLSRMRKQQRLEWPKVVRKKPELARASADLDAVAQSNEPKEGKLQTER
jgi:hypothetical protein